jgi:signal transduction histidine kinase
MLLLIPVNIYEVVYEFPHIKLYWAVFLAALPLFFMQEYIIGEYILVAALVYMLLSLTYGSYKKISEYTRQIDELREKNYNLVNNIDKGARYSNQIKYFSQLEERNKIAQEIHDKIGHTISASLMQLEAARLLLDIDRDKARSIIQNTIEVLREGMEGIRAALRSIKPPAEQMGIGRIRLLLNEFAMNSNIESLLNYNGELSKISQGNWKNIYENVSEALTNIAKYSGASSVRVSLEVLNKFVKCEIKDNGKGCDKITKGLGIMGMEERTEGVGGKVIIDGTDGFSLIFLLPVDTSQ